MATSAKPKIDLKVEILDHLEDDEDKELLEVAWKSMTSKLKAYKKKCWGLMKITIIEPAGKGSWTVRIVAVSGCGTQAMLGGKTKAEIEKLNTDICTALDMKRVRQKDSPKEAKEESATSSEGPTSDETPRSMIFEAYENVPGPTEEDLRSTTAGIVGSTTISEDEKELLSKEDLGDHDYFSGIHFRPDCPDVSYVPLRGDKSAVPMRCLNPPLRKRLAAEYSQRVMRSLQTLKDIIAPFTKEELTERLQERGLEATGASLAALKNELQDRREYTSKEIRNALDGRNVLKDLLDAPDVSPDDFDAVVDGYFAWLNSGKDRAKSIVEKSVSDPGTLSWEVEVDAFVCSKLEELSERQNRQLLHNFRKKREELPTRDQFCTFCTESGLKSLETGDDTLETGDDTFLIHNTVLLLFAYWFGLGVVSTKAVDTVSQCAEDNATIRFLLFLVAYEGEISNASQMKIEWYSRIWSKKERKHKYFDLCPVCEIRFEQRLRGLLELYLGEKYEFTPSLEKSRDQKIIELSGIPMKKVDNLFIDGLALDEAKLLLQKLNRRQLFAVRIDEDGGIACSHLFFVENLHDFSLWIKDLICFREPVLRLVIKESGICCTCAAYKRKGSCAHTLVYELFPARLCEVIIWVDSSPQKTWKTSER